MVAEVSLSAGESVVTCCLRSDLLTFSKPRNLSRPSCVRVPAFWSIFSSGVTSVVISSFFLVGASLAAGVVEG